MNGRVWFVAEIAAGSAPHLAAMLRRAGQRAQDHADRLEQSGWGLKSQTAADRRAEKCIELAHLARDCARLAAALDRAYRGPDR